MDLPHYQDIVAITAGMKRAEGDLDRTMANTATLLAQTLQAGRATGLHTHQVQRPVEQLLATLTKLKEARSDLVQYHGTLAKLGAKHLGCDATSWGDVFPCPDPVATVPDRTVVTLPVAA